MKWLSFMSEIEERMSSLRQKLLHCSLLFLIVIFSLSHQTFAKELEGSSREEVLTHIQKAFDAQVSLTEKARSQEEIKHILSTYFEDELIEQYMKENVHELDGQFIVYGSDFPMYAIPFFTYDENTRVLEQANERIVYEFFPASTDGPVGYEDHYEVVKMRNKIEGWKVYSIRNETKQPEILEEQITSEEENNKKDKDETEVDVQSKEKETKQTEIINKQENSKVQSKLKSSLHIDGTNLYIKQSFKELNDVLLFSSFYVQTKNILKEYFQSKASFFKK